MKINEVSHQMIAQSCSSRECRKKYKSQISELSETITTVHEFDKNKQTVKCISCGKITKLNSM